MKRFTEAELPQTADVLVVGGGITGASIARDAALRGLAVVLVERDDFAAGTSSRSSKLIHGGLRYLQTRQVRMVHESVREREVMMRIAPHRARLQPFLYLIHDGDPEGRRLVQLGLSAYDLFARAPRARRHRMLSQGQVLSREPHLDPSGLRGAGLFYDTSTDDARLVLDVLGSASQAGALVANYREVTGFIHARGTVAGAEVADRLNGTQMTIRARVVVNAAGPWVDRVRGLGRAVPAPLLRPTKGVHLVLRREDFPLGTAVFTRSPTDDRVVWPTPAADGNHVYIGTTDTAYTGSIDDVTADSHDVEYLLAAANHALPGANVGPGHIVGTWAGLRPLLAPSSGTTDNGAVPREHAIRHESDRMITVAGGKLTTARLMGQQVVDVVVAELADRHGVPPVPASRTAGMPISGGDPADLFRARRLAEGYPHREAAARWYRRFGGSAIELLARTPPEQAIPIEGTALTRAEIEYVIQAEAAMTISDVLIRRTGSFFWSADGDAAAIDHVAQCLADSHGYNTSAMARQRADYLDWVTRNRPAR